MNRLTWLSRTAPALGPGALMLVIALVGAGRPVLSWDEVTTADVATRTPGQIWHLAHNIDGVFAPYYVLMHYWTTLVGSSVLDLRLPSIIAMSAAVALAGELGRRLYGPAIGTLAGLLLCLMPNTSRYAAEARPYAFACFFALLAPLLLHLAVHRPHPARWAGYGLAVTLLGLSHVIALTTLLAHVVFLCRHRDRRTLLGWATATAGALLALAPVLWLGVHQRGAQLSWVTPLTVGSLWNFPADVVGSQAGGWLLLGLALLALWRPIRHRAEIAAFALGPILVVATMSLVIAPYWVVRYMLVVLAPLALLTAAGLWTSEPAAPRWRSPRPDPGPGSEPASYLRLVDTDTRLRMADRQAQAVPAGAELLRTATTTTQVPNPRRPLGAPVSGAPPLAPGRRHLGTLTARNAHLPAILAGRDDRAPARKLILRTVSVLVLVAGAMLPGQLAVRGKTAKNGSDYRSAAAIIRSGEQPGDGIVYFGHPRTMRAGLNYYLGDDPGQPRDVLLNRSAAETGSLHALEFRPTADRFSGTNRLWVMLYRSHRDPLTTRKDLRRLLVSQYRQIGVWDVKNGTLALFVRR